jgi:hypothetical protein
MQWWVDILDNFNDFPPAAKALISDFVGIAEHELELVEKEKPKPVVVPEQKPVPAYSSTAKGVNQAIPEGKENEETEEDKKSAGEEEEWQHIEGKAAKPQGCCVIS